MLRLGVALSAAVRSMPRWHGQCFKRVTVPFRINDLLEIVWSTAMRNFATGPTGHSCFLQRLRHLAAVKALVAALLVTSSAHSCEFRIADVRAFQAGLIALVTRIVGDGVCTSAPTSVKCNLPSERFPLSFSWEDGVAVALYVGFDPASMPKYRPVVQFILDGVDIVDPNRRFKEELSSKLTERGTFQHTAECSVAMLQQPIFELMFVGPLLGTR